MNFRLWLETEFHLGQVIEVPASANRSEFKVKVVKISGDNVWLTQHLNHNDLIGAFKMTRSAVKHFINDLSGKVEVNKTTTDPYINKVLNGQATYLGKGDDGIAYSVDDKVVKVSTTVPYNPTNPYHRTVAGAARTMAMNCKLTEKLRQEGVPGILPTYFKVVGDKVFTVRSKVDIPKTLTKDQYDEVKKSVEAIHKAGYAIKDQIQVGIYGGKMYHYDLGKLGQGDKHDFDADMDQLKSLPVDYDRLEREWMDQYDLRYFLFNDKDYIRKMTQLKRMMIKKFPERKQEIEKQFEDSMNPE